MSDLVVLYLITMVGLCVLGSLFVVYRYFLGNKLNAAADKLKSQMATIRRDFPELGRNPREYVEQTIGDIGIEGLMQQFGVDPGILKSPLVKGLIEKYAPRVLEQLSKQQNKGNEQQQNLL